MQSPMFYRHILDLYLRYICFSFYFWHISGDQSGDQPMWRPCHFIALKLFPGLKYIITELILIFLYFLSLIQCQNVILKVCFSWNYLFGSDISLFGGVGGALEVLKKIYQPHVIFKILGPPWWTLPNPRVWNSNPGAPLSWRWLAHNA